MDQVPQLLFSWCMGCGFENCNFADEKQTCVWCDEEAEFMPFGQQPATTAALAAYCRRVADAVCAEVARKCAEVRARYPGEEQVEELVAQLEEKAEKMRRRLYERALAMENRGRQRYVG